MNKYIILSTYLLFNSCVISSKEIMLNEKKSLHTTPSIFGSLQALPNNNNIKDENYINFEKKMNYFITKIDDNSWRINLTTSQAFQLLSRIVSQNYILSFVDKERKLLSTEWDKFFIDGRLFRNKLNINVFHLSNKISEIVIKNSVEYYNDTNNKNNISQENNWLPSPDLTNETERIVNTISKNINNIAINN